MIECQPNIQPLSFVFGNNNVSEFSEICKCKTHQCKRNVYQGMQEPGWAPSSITCNLETICPALWAFEAKQIRIDGFSFPAICACMDANAKSI